MKELAESEKLLSAGFFILKNAERRRRL